MYKLLTNAIVERVRARQTEGDCPTQPAYPAETLENALLDLADRLPRRCDTNLAAPNGECIACCADQGVACRSPAVSERSEAP
jgi:hypothetical protein